ncbi:hypothetical protein AX15_000147 [Amanita polypyramis BW_CC]|nr:hypothetical protein AX15_000147 [Amanita polypyramis BW_CC]
MSRLVSLWKKHQDQQRTGAADIDATASPSSSIHRKIHPNLDSLVARPQPELPSSTVSNSSDFIPLKPPARGRPYSTSLQPKQASFPTESRSPEQEKLTAAAYISSSTPGDAWSTFGRGKRPSSHIKENIEPSTTTQGVASNHETRGSTRLRTSTSASQSTDGSSPNSRSVWTHSRYSPSSHNDVVSTPIITERRSSPSSYHTFGKRTSSPYIPIETPPPLPPLDHPAFQSAAPRARDLLSSSSNFACTDSPERHPRHSVSLPSISTAAQARLRTTSGTSKYVHSAKRAYHDSSLHQFDESKDKVACPNKYTKQKLATANRNKRSRSKSSYGSRQSSTEYNSKQATVTSCSNTEEGEPECREAELSCDLVRVNEDPFPKVANDLSVSGNTFGDNVHLCRQTLLLRNSFLFRDTRHHILPQAGWHGDYNTSPFAHDITRSGEAKRKTNEMDQSDASTYHRSKTNETPQPDTKKGSQTRVKPPNRARSTSPSIQGRISQPAAETLLVPPSLSLTSPTPETSPISPFHSIQSRGQGGSSGSHLTTPPSALKSSGSRTTGKRKADEAEVGTGSPSKDSRKEYRATFAPDQRPHRISENSGSSQAPSSYRRKRARLSTSSDLRPLSRSSTMTSLRENLSAGNTGSWPSRASTRGQPLASPSHHLSRQSISMQSQRLSNHSQSHRPSREPSRRRSLSGASIPISALVSPHAPSISRSKTFHMHDPRKPGPIQRTSWVLSLPSQAAQGEPRLALKGWVERGGSPIHAWLFFLGFLFFPVWWLAAFIGIPKTRRIGEGETEKGVVLDDPQVEYNSTSWRTRCRVMSVISFFTYIPFIILVAIFARR